MVPAVSSAKEVIMEEKEVLQEESNLLTLTDENGEEMTFEYMDCIEYDQKEYLVLLPEDDEDNSLVILEVQPVDEENENYIPVAVDAILDAVYSIFKDRYKDVLTFAD